MVAWDFYHDGEMQFKPAEWALDFTLREVFEDKKFSVMVYSTGTRYALLFIDIPPAFVITHNNDVQPRGTKKE